MKAILDTLAIRPRTAGTPDRRSGLRPRLRFGRLLRPLGLSLLAVGGLGRCSQPPPANVMDAVAPPTLDEDRPADFVLLVDDSASITRPQQRILRSAVLMLADLARADDRIAVVAFGSEARVAVAPMRVPGLDGRPAFRAALDTALSNALTFRGRDSDILAGARLIVDRKDTLFVDGDQRVAAPIFLTDGKLEPGGLHRVARRARSAKQKAAFDALQRLTQTQMRTLRPFALLLGDRRCHDPLFTRYGDKVTGADLMRDVIAGGDADRFLHAVRFDQVFELVVQALQRIRGEARLDRARSTFKTDPTTERLTIVVRKAVLDKKGRPQRLAKTGALRLVAPDGRALRFSSPRADGLYWGRHDMVDVIVVTKPTPGLWRVEVPNPKVLVLGRIESPVILRLDLPRVVYSNEESVMIAGLWNRRTASWLTAPAELYLGTGTAKVGVKASSETPGTFVVRLPGGVPGLATTDVDVARSVDVNCSAVRPGMPTFERVATETFELRPPFVDWLEPSTRLTMELTEALQVELGATPLSAARTPDFSAPPSLFVDVSLFTEGEGYHKYGDQELKPGPGGAWRAQPVRLDEVGHYRLRYTLRGTTRDGKPFTLRSPAVQFEVVRGWTYALFAGLVVIVALGAFWALWVRDLRYRYWATLYVSHEEKDGKPIAISPFGQRIIDTGTKRYTVRRDWLGRVYISMINEKGQNGRPRPGWRISGIRTSQGGVKVYRSDPAIYLYASFALDKFKDEEEETVPEQRRRTT